MSDTLPRAIESVLIQNYPNFELIVVDDNNPDSDYRLKTEKLMQNYLKYDHVNYIKHDKNKNGSAARNTGAKNSNGDYIMLLDDDDEFLQGKIKAQVEKMETLDNSWGASYTNYIRTKNGKFYDQSKESREGYLLKQELMRDLFIQAGSNLMIRRKAYFEIGGFDESFQRNQDIEFTCRLLRKYKLAYVNHKGLIHHKYSKKLNLTHLEITNHFIQKMEFYIDEFDLIDQNNIYNMLYLQNTRYLISKKKYLEACKYLSSKNISKRLFIKYLFHLINRRRKKSIYGFHK